MEYIVLLFNFIMHIDRHLTEIIQNYGAWTYLIVFAIIFSETGFVVTPFLPGDSLLFVIGALCAAGSLNTNLIIVLLIFAAFSGNTVNYLIGKFIGHKVQNSRFIKKEYLQKAQEFYAKHGGKAIIICRFLPILRTFSPFVAGIGKMSLIMFVIYNLIGGIAWVTLFTSGGYFFGNIPAVKNHFSLVVIGIIVITILPALLSYIKIRFVVINKR